MSLKGKKIVLGISGGIAAYKCAELVRQLKRSGAEVEVIMTQAAQKFITPLTMETLSEKKVHTNLFPDDEFSATLHINLADWADVVLIAPATANIIAKINNGIGDDLLSTVCLAAWRKTVIAPAMNSNMWANPAVQCNLKELTKNGYIIIEPVEGDLACGYTGTGRLPDLTVLLHWLKYAMTTKKDLAGKTVLVTAGRTEEEIDPVRIITNRSSGKMGFALASEAFYRGAKVKLVAGPNNLLPPPRVDYYPVGSAEDMYDAVFENLDDVDIMIANAAVSDYRSKNVLFRKMKKDKKEIELAMVANPDILGDAGKRKGNRILIGFALETDNEHENARKKLKGKNLDMIVINNPTEDSAAFASETNRVTIIKKSGKPVELPLMEKTQVAQKIMNEVLKLAGKKKKSAK
jgi:phosphopantothenoylcysteine decarboxylase/phosphopantothenate--cysteine ligase